MTCWCRRRCSKLCSDRVGKRRIGTRLDRMAIGGFSAGNNAFRCDLREADRALTGFQDRRLQPLGHLSVKAKYTVTRYLRGTPLTGAGETGTPTGTSRCRLNLKLLPLSSL